MTTSDCMISVFSASTVKCSLSLMFLENLRVFECALVRFVDATFDNQSAAFSIPFRKDLILPSFRYFLLLQNFLFKVRRGRIR